MKATRNGKLEAVKRLLAAGCSVAVRDRNSKFKLHRISCARCGSVLLRRRRGTLCTSGGGGVDDVTAAGARS